MADEEKDAVTLSPHQGLEIPRFEESPEPTGGTIKESPEDFVVEEIPAYEPSGEGEHLMLLLTKRDLTTNRVVKMLARHYEVPEKAVGFAGQKDRRAVTRQFFSVHAPAATPSPPDLGEDVTVDGIWRHSKRLKTGHLKGNRFRIVVRRTSISPDEASGRAGRFLLTMAERGMPNFFGPQRFGLDGDTARWGFALLGCTDVEIPRRVHRSRSLRRLALSAAQSAIYNRYLSLRMQNGLLRRVLTGDVLVKVDTGGMFNAEEARMAEEQRRMDARQIVHAGPMFGRKTFASHSDARALEESVLQDMSVELSAFSRHGKLLPGTRRRDLVFPTETSASVQGDGFVATFTLPRGSYATVLIRQITGGPCG